MRRRARKSNREPIIALINVIFLILIFFIVVGSLSGPADESLEFVQTSELDCCAPPDALVVLADGRMQFRGGPVASAAAYLALLPEGAAAARIVPDRRLPARELLTLIRDLREAGARQVIVLTEHTA